LLPWEDCTFTPPPKTPFADMLGETDATLPDADACVVAFLDFHQITHRTQCHSR